MASAPLDDAGPIATIRRRLPPLSRRQHDVLWGVLLGWTNDEIALHLRISRSMVKVHVTKLMRKLGISSRHEVRWAVTQRHPRAGTLAPDGLTGAEAAG